jgi:hypothetical protein
MDFITLDSMQLLFGVFFLVVGASMSMHTALWKHVTDAIHKGGEVFVFTGIFHLLLGLFITIFHWDLDTVGHTIISIIGVVSLVKAGLFLLVPDAGKTFLKGDLNGMLTKMGGGLGIAIGIVLLLL